MHAAKGLEFPVSVLLGVATQPNNACPPVALRCERSRGVPAVEPSRPHGYGDVLADERAMDRFEQRRLLYVAATRARDLLIVSVHRPASKVASASLVTELSSECAVRPELWSDGSALAASVAGAPTGGPGDGSATPLRCGGPGCVRGDAGDDARPGGRARDRERHRRAVDWRSPDPVSMAPTATMQMGPIRPLARPIGAGPAPRWAGPCTACCRSSISRSRAELESLCAGPGGGRRHCRADG